MEEKKSGGAFWYLLGGFAAGATVGVLLAPKRGIETREDLGAWGRRGRDRAQTMLSRISAKIPARVKAGAAFGAVKGGVSSAAATIGDKAREEFGS